MNKKVIFITAAAGAMGSSQAQIFSKHGYKIFLTDIDKKKLITGNFLFSEKHKGFFSQ